MKAYTPGSKQTLSSLCADDVFSPSIIGHLYRYIGHTVTDRGQWRVRAQAITPNMLGAFDDGYHRFNLAPDFEVTLYHEQELKEGTIVY